MNLGEKLLITLFVLMQIQALLLGWWIRILEKRVNLLLDYIVKKEHQHLTLEEMRTRVTYEDGC